MSSKTKSKNFFYEKFGSNRQSNRSFKKKILSPSNIMCKQKSKVSSKKQKQYENHLRITPSLVQRNGSKLHPQSTLVPQQSVSSLRSKRSSLITIPGSSKLAKKNITEHIYTAMESDYEATEIGRFKSELKWISKNHPGSTLNNDICYEYGYSQLSQAKSNIKPAKNMSKNKKKFPDQSEIQRLLAKYTKHIQQSPNQVSSTEKTQNFRTLSTEDKSQKKFEFTKKSKNCLKKNSILKKVISAEFSQQKHKQKSKKKTFKPKIPKNSTETFLPDYFDCLLINQVESKIQTVEERKQKDDKESAKQTKQSTSKTSRGKTHRKSRQILLITKVKKDCQNLKEVKQFCNKDTRKSRLLKQLNTHRSTISPQKKRSEENAKIKAQKKSRKSSKKYKKVNLVEN